MKLMEKAIKAVVKGVARFILIVFLLLVGFYLIRYLIPSMFMYTFTCDLGIETKSEYNNYDSDDNVIIDTTVVNNGKKSVNNVEITVGFLDGYMIEKTYSRTKNVETLEPGEELYLRTIYTKTENSVTENREFLYLADNKYKEAKTILIKRFLIISVLLLFSLLYLNKLKKSDKTTIGGLFICKSITFILVIAFFIALGFLIRRVCNLGTVHFDEQIVEFMIEDEKVELPVTVTCTSNKASKRIFTKYMTYYERYPGIVDIDRDYDGFSDSTEEWLGTNPFLRDTFSSGYGDANYDTDKDGIPNYYEDVLFSWPGDKTDCLAPDTDYDGLSDYDEWMYGTDPVNRDTDGDGATDGFEVEHEYDPLVYDDMFEVSIYHKAEEKSEPVTNMIVNIKGKGEVVNSLRIEEITHPLLNTAYGTPYMFSIDGEFEEAEIVFECPWSTTKEHTDYAVYYLDEKTQKAIEIESVLEGNLIKAKVEHFSIYFLKYKTDFSIYAFDRSKYIENINKVGDTSVSFVIDRSASIANFDDNTFRNLVKDLASNLVENNNKVGLVTFRQDAETPLDLTDDIEQFKTKVDAIEIDNGRSSGSGTDLNVGLKYGIDMLFHDDSDNKRAIVLITDGDMRRKLYKDMSETLLLADRHDVTVYCLCLAKNANSDLLRFCEGTGGKLYFIDDFESLDVVEVFEDIEKQINADLELDSNADGIPDYYADLIARHIIDTDVGGGVYIDVEGPDYENRLAVLNGDPDYDGDGLLNGEELEIIHEDNGNVYIFVHSLPTKKDSDGDGIEDSEDEEPLIFGQKDGVIGTLTLAVSTHNTGHAWLLFDSFVDYTLVNEAFDVVTITV